MMLIDVNDRKPDAVRAIDLKVGDIFRASGGMLYMMVRVYDEADKYIMDLKSGLVMRLTNPDVMVIKQYNGTLTLNEV